MSTLNCEYIRDVYPDVLNGNVDGELAQKVRAHIAACDDCRAEAALLGALRAVPVTVPAGLEKRVTMAASQRRARWRVTRGELAMVATLAAALIGGSLLIESPAPRRVQAPTQAGQGYGFVSVEDAMVSGTSSLEDLSVEQLEKLLGEIGS